MSIISYISCTISSIGNRKIVGTQNSLGHRFWLAAPKILAQIRPWTNRHTDGRTDGRTKPFIELRVRN